MSGTILDEILAHKATEVAARRSRRSQTDIERDLSSLPLTRGFSAALQEAVSQDNSAVIAEVKKASPSKGIIREHFDPVEIAASYVRGGATCLSILTDEKYFQGHDEYLQNIRTRVNLPLLRKEFIVDAYQIPESRLLGADCILLIVSALEPSSLREFYEQATELHLDVLIEVHDRAELDIAIELNPPLIGINNRNLKTFETSLSNTFDLLDAIPDGVTVVTESGIHSREDVQKMRQQDVHAFLVGEAFMRAEDPGAALRTLFG